MTDTPWIKWYPSDFLNGISDLSPHEIAVYTVILCRIYDEDGPIRDDVQKIARRCNMRLPECEKAIQMLVEDGKLSRADGYLDNERAQKERTKRTRKRQQSASNAAQRWQEGSEKPNKNNDRPMQTHSRDDAKPMLYQRLEARNQKDDDDAREPDEVERIKIKTGLADDPNLSIGGFHEIRAWIAAGADEELIAAAITETLAKKRDGPPTSWRYFEGPVMQAVNYKLTDIPPQFRRAPDERKAAGDAAIDRLKAEIEAEQVA